MSKPGIRLMACGSRTLLVLALGLVLVLCGIAAGEARAAEGEACPNEQRRQESALNQVTGMPYSTELPDCRAYEMVTPVEKGQATILNPVLAAGDSKPSKQAAVDGEALMYQTDNALPGASSSPLFGQAAAYRSESGWIGIQLSAPQTFVEEESSLVNVFQYFSSNLTCGLDETREPLETFASGEPAPLPAGEAAGEVFNLYLWDRETGAYTLVSNTNPANRLALSVFTTGYHVYGASEDCSHVFFETEYRLLPAASASGADLYEYDEGTLRLVSVLPDGTAVPVAVTPNNTNAEGTLIGAISDDSARSFFTATSDSGADAGKKEVFMSEAGRTVEVSQSQTSTPDGGAEFESASSDGSQVLFLANYGLTTSSSQGLATCNISGGCDLYDYDVKAGTLSDLTADTNAADTEGADVQGVLGAAQNDSYVYFAALGQLIPGMGRPEAENEARSEVGLYVWHEGQLSYIATIPKSDVTSNIVTRIGQISSRVTPDGSGLLFGSSASLTGYDNVTPSGEHVRELYLYTAQSQRLACVSCDPEGAAPAASGATEVAATEYNNGYSPRDLSASGDQAYFTSYDVLAGGALAGERNAYEWEREGSGSCTSADAHAAALYSGGCIYLLAAGGSFVDASAGGEDVFIASRIPLVKQDLDGSEDIYDVRVDGGFPAPPAGASCAGEACQGEQNAESLQHPTLASTGVPAVGNAEAHRPGKKPARSKSTTRARKLAAALRACRKRTKRRSACEARVRKRYGLRAKRKRYDVRAKRKRNPTHQRTARGQRAASKPNSKQSSGKGAK